MIVSAGFMARELLDDHYVLLRREGFGASAAGVVRRVHHYECAAHRGGVARHRAPIRAAVHIGRARGTHQVPDQVRSDLPFKSEFYPGVNF